VTVSRVIVLVLSAVFMAFKLVQLQAQHDAYSAVYAAEKQDNTATPIR
jgi:hypothetical protein